MGLSGHAVRATKDQPLSGVNRNHRGPEHGLNNLIPPAAKPPP